MHAHRRRTWTLAVFMLAGTSTPTVAQTDSRAELSLNRGLEAFRAADYRLARRHFESAVADQPGFAAAHYFLGLTFMQTASTLPQGAEREALLERALSEFNQSRLLDPHLVLAYLDAAIAEVILGRLNDAESGFRQFIEERPDDPLPYLFLAVVYYRQAREDASYLARAEENLDRASAAIARAERRDPTLISYVEFYRSLVHLERDEREQAVAALRRSHEAAPDTEIGRQAKELLDKVERGRLARRPWDLTLQLGYDWDSNVVLRGRRTSRSIADRDDEDCRFGLASAFTYRFIDRSDLVVGAGAVTYNSWHTDIKQYNVQTYGVNVYAGYTPPAADWLTLGLRYDADHSLLDNQTYLIRHRVTPQVDVQWVDWTSTTFFYQFDHRDYRQGSSDWRLDRDGDIHSVGVVQDFSIVEMFDRSLKASLSYRFENVSTHGREFDARHHILGFGVGVPLPDDFTVDFASEWEIQRYKNRSLFDRDGSRRRDVIHTMILGLSKRFNEQLSARLTVEVTKDDSNVRDRGGQEFFSYDRVIYGVSVAYQF